MEKGIAVRLQSTSYMGENNFVVEVTEFLRLVPQHNLAKNDQVSTVMSIQINCAVIPIQIRKG